ncbi:MAG: hypothetical protein LBU15_03870 [Rickettsiales bacterium]|jgi:hypothetical protein|nr:hypothetical protein [Rickettsiales bacterium]
MQRVELSVGTIKASIGYSNESERELILATARELNVEYNRLIISCGNVDENILLFFLLIKTEIKLQSIDQGNVDVALFSVLKSIGGYLQEKNSTKIKESLVAIGIIRKIELNNKSIGGESASGGGAESETALLVSNFAEELRGNIKTIENNILLL